jgi:type II secretory pathway component PulF
MRFFIILLFFFRVLFLAQTEYPRTTSVLLLTRPIVRQFWRTEAQSFSFGFDFRTLQREGLAVQRLMAMCLE